MTIVFKSGKTMKVDPSTVKQIKEQMPSTGTQYYFWINDGDNNPIVMINVFDISHIKP